MTDSQTLRERLRAEPWLPGIVKVLLQQSWATDEDLRTEIARACQTLNRMSGIIGCGQLTARERSFMNRWTQGA